MSVRIAVVKSSSYQDLWVTDISNVALDIFMSSLMRCSPIGLLELAPTDFIIVKESQDPPCQEIQSCIPDQFKDNLKYSRESKNPSLPFLDETFHKDRSLDEISHSVDDIDWSKYGIILTINACIPNRVIAKYPQILWCYYVGENDGRIDTLLGNYDVILNQDVMRSNLPPHAVGFPYTYIGPTTIEDLNRRGLGNDVSKAGIFMEINNTQERPVRTIPAEFAAIAAQTGQPIICHNQNIITNTKNLYGAKYFVKLMGRWIRGNSVMETVSAGTLILANRRLVSYADLIPVACHVETTADVIAKIAHFDSHPDDYAAVIRLQRAYMDKFYFRRPLDLLMKKYQAKTARQRILIMFVSRSMDSKWLDNIRSIQQRCINVLGHNQIDIACISGTDDADTYESVLGHIKYKVVSDKPQFSKLFDFVASCPETYDWYIKLRPDIELLEDITQQKLSSFCKNSVNARVRRYVGNARIPYGASIGGRWQHINNAEIHHAPHEKHIILDDQVYIFHRSVIEKGGFEPIDESNRIWGEQFISDVWTARNIRLNPIGLRVIFHHCEGPIESGHVNMHTLD